MRDGRNNLQMSCLYLILIGTELQCEEMVGMLRTRGLVTGDSRPDENDPFTDVLLCSAYPPTNPHAHKTEGVTQNWGNPLT